jgi:hypothetical protein
MFAKSPENVRIISFSCKNAVRVRRSLRKNVVLLIADIEAHATSSQLLAVDSKATMPFAPAVVGDVSQMLFLRDLRASVY